MIGTRGPILTGGRSMHLIPVSRLDRTIAFGIGRGMGCQLSATTCFHLDFFPSWMDYLLNLSLRPLRTSGEISRIIGVRNLPYLRVFYSLIVGVQTNSTRYIYIPIGFDTIKHEIPKKTCVNYTHNYTQRQKETAITLTKKQTSIVAFSDRPAI